MELTKQQKDVLSWARNKKGSLNLVARAGCGKTSTLLEIAGVISGQAFLGAYNKAIAEELKTRLSDRGFRDCEAATMHSIGLRAWKRAHPEVLVDGNKTYQILYNYLEKKEIPDLEGLIPAVAKAVSLAKQSLTIPPEKHDPEYFSLISTLVTHYGVDEDFPFTADTLEIVHRTHRESFETDPDVVDFDDMITAAIVHDAQIQGYNWIFIDEAQDTNAARQELAIRMMRKGSRLVAVGDERQAIYGFTGAFSDAMDQISNRLGSDSLPLNMTFRCGKSIVAYAQQWVPDIQAFKDNPQGSVTHIEDYQAWLKNKFSPNEVILCRNNAPLVELAYYFIREGIGVRVEGRDIGQGLIKFAKRFKQSKLSKIGDLVHAYEKNKRDEFTRKKQFSNIQALEDKCATLNLIIDNLLHANVNADIVELELWVSKVFGDTSGVQRLLTLSTVHKAKGREWDRVNLLGRNLLMPSFYAKEEWQLTQEQNLIYVAVTRAKTELVEVDLPRKEY